MFPSCQAGSSRSAYIVAIPAWTSRMLRKPRTATTAMTRATASNAAASFELAFSSPNRHDLPSPLVRD